MLTFKVKQSKECLPNFKTCLRFIVIGGYLHCGKTKPLEKNSKLVAMTTA